MLTNEYPDTKHSITIFVNVLIRYFQIDLMEFISMMHDTLGKTDTMEEIKMAFR